MGGWLVGIRVVDCCTWTTWDIRKLQLFFGLPNPLPRFFCLMVQIKKFSLYEDVTITCEGLQIFRPLLHIRDQWACFTCCDTEHLFVWSFPRTRRIRMHMSISLLFIVKDRELSKMTSAGNNRFPTTRSKIIFVYFLKIRLRMNLVPNYFNIFFSTNTNHFQKKNTPPFFGFDIADTA